MTALALPSVQRGYRSRQTMIREAIVGLLGLRGDEAAALLGCARRGPTTRPLVPRVRAGLVAVVVLRSARGLAMQGSAGLH